jgi:hypothetical protein
LYPSFLHCTAFITAVGVREWEKGTPKFQLRNFILSFGFVTVVNVVSAVGVLFLLNVHFDALLQAFDSWRAALTFVLSLASASAVFITYAAWLDTRHLDDREIRRRRLLGLTFTFLIALNFLLLYAAAFGTAIYGKIPQALGGDRPLPIPITFKGPEGGQGTPPAEFMSAA